MKVETEPASVRPETYLFDLSRLAHEIDSNLDRRQGRLELGRFEERTPKKNPFIYEAEDRHIDFRGKAPLFLDEVQKGGLLAGIFDMQLDERIGYIFLETGEIDPTSTEPDVYETMRLRIKEPLRRRDGLVIPNCSVKIYAQSGEWKDRYIERRDHVRKGGLIWRREDISKMLPTEWFMKS